VIVVRYPDSQRADKIAAEIATRNDAADRLEVELVERTETSGRRHVTDPKSGASPVGKHNVLGSARTRPRRPRRYHRRRRTARHLALGIITAVARGLFGIAAGRALRPLGRKSDLNPTTEADRSISAGISLANSPSGLPTYLASGPFHAAPGETVLRALCDDA